MALIKQFLDFVYKSRKAEHHHMIPRLDVGVTVNKHSLAVAYHGGDGHSVGQTQILYRVAGDFTARFRLDFRYLGIGQRKAFRG